MCVYVCMSMHLYIHSYGTAALAVTRLKRISSEGAWDGDGDDGAECIECSRLNGRWIWPRRPAGDHAALGDSLPTALLQGLVDLFSSVTSTNGSGSGSGSSSGSGSGLARPGPGL